MTFGFRSVDNRVALGATALAVLFNVFRKSSKDRRELLRYEAMTGLSDRQPTDLVVRVHAVCAQKFVSRGRPHALGLFRSVAMVVCLLRKNATQDFVGAVFGVSQPTVSRRWDLLVPVIGDVLAEAISAPREVAGRGIVLVAIPCAQRGTGTTSRSCTRPRSGRR